MAFDIDQKYFYGHGVFQSPWADSVGLGLDIIGEMNYPTLSPLATSLNHGLELGNLVTSDDRGTVVAEILGGIVGAHIASTALIHTPGREINLTRAILVGLGGYEGGYLSKRIYNVLTSSNQEDGNDD